RDLSSRTVVPERPRRPGVPEAADVGATVVAGDDDAERTVRGDAGPAFGQVVADPTGHVGEQLRIPDPVRVVLQRLVEEREVRGAHHAATARHSERPYLGCVELQQRLRCYLGDRELADAEH